MANRLTRFALLLAVACNLQALADPPAAPARLIVIVSDSFEGVLGESIARAKSRSAPWKMEVVEVSDGLPPAEAGSKRLDGPYPVYLLMAANGTVLDKHVGVAHADEFFAAKARQLSLQRASAN